MKPKKIPSRKVLAECFDYYPDSGVLTWKVRPRKHFSSAKAWRVFNTKHAGREAGYRHDYIVVKFTLRWISVTVKAHRIILAMMGVHIPDTMEVDHADRNTYNNRLSNLRLATMGQNQANRVVKKNRAVLHSGLPKGVHKIGKKFMAKSGVTYLGLFATQEAASNAYLDEARKKYGDFARG